MTEPSFKPRDPSLPEPKKLVILLSDNPDTAARFINHNGWQDWECKPAINVLYGDDYKETDKSLTMLAAPRRNSAVVGAITNLQRDTVGTIILTEAEAFMWRDSKGLMVRRQAAVTYLLRSRLPTESIIFLANSVTLILHGEGKAEVFRANHNFPVKFDLDDASQVTC